jgi:23S rRNA pseudouridine2605 synthase
MRLNRFLASCGLGSRRSCEELVRQGRVAVNGTTVADLALRIREDDVVKVDGRRCRAPAMNTTIVLNKPRGYLCTREDEPHLDRQTIYDLLPPHLRKLHYVGRLDRDSEGLILLTDSGELTERLAHPRFGIQKEYLVALDRAFDIERDRARMLEGFAIDGGFARAFALRLQTKRMVSIVLTQGLKRQVRLMFEHLGYRVRRLERVRIGGLMMPGLKLGRWRALSGGELEQLFARCPSPPPATGTGQR